MIEGRLTGSPLIEIYKADNDLLAIRLLAEEGLADLENLADGESKNDESLKAGEVLDADYTASDSDDSTIIEERCFHQKIKKALLCVTLNNS